MSPGKGVNVVYDGDDQAPRLMMPMPADDTESVTVTLRNPTVEYAPVTTTQITNTRSCRYTAGIEHSALFGQHHVAERHEGAALVFLSRSDIVMYGRGKGPASPP